MKIALVGKSGVGKSTQEKLMSERLDIPRIISTTTRDIRPGEANGVDYHFVSREQFEQLLTSGEMVEHAQFKGNYYGIQKSSLLNDFIIVIEPAGAKRLRELFSDIVCILLILPEDEREARINGRGVPMTAQDEDRFDTFKPDHVIGADGTIEDVYQRLSLLYAWILENKADKLDAVS